MKKIIYLIASILILSTILVACSSSDKPTNDKEPDRKAGLETTTGEDGEIVTFEATVIDDNSGLLVTPLEGSSELNSSDKIYITLSTPEGDKNQTSQQENYKPGDIVEITYDGLIAESYPAQITASKIELVGRNILIDGYKVIVDDIYLEDTALNDGITMIAFDTSNWIGLSNAEKELFFSIIKEQHNLDVIEGTYDDIKEMGLTDEVGLYFKEGILIEMKDMKYNKESSELKAGISKWRAGDGAIGWTVNATNKDGQWWITRDNNWIS